MPSLDHELLVDLFRHRGDLAPALLKSVVGLELAHAVAEPQSNELPQTAPTAYHADAVILLRDKHNAITDGVVVEVQLRSDPGKRLSWPVYVTNLRARHDCPVALLVLVPSPSVARWAQTPIETGHPGFTLQPIVIELDDIPHIIDLDEAQKLPELAVLSAIAHPKLEITKPALGAISSLPSERRRLYMAAVFKALASHASESATKETQMQPSLEARLKQIERKQRRDPDFNAFMTDPFLYIERLEQREQQARAYKALAAAVSAKLRVLRSDDEAAVRQASQNDDAATSLAYAVSKARTAAQVRTALAASLAASRKPG